MAPAAAAYLVVLLLMTLTALSRWQQTPALWTGMTAAGALLFLASDALLAVREFRRKLPGAGGAVLAAYYAAQCCIALG